MPATEAQLRAIKRYNAKNKDKKSVINKVYYEKHCERIKAKRMERHYLKKQQKAQEKANLLQYPSSN